MVTEPDTAAQIQRLREMAENANSVSTLYRLDGAGILADEWRGRHDLLSAAADALEREAWCEERKVDVTYIGSQSRWMVISCDAQPWRRRYHHGKARNAAIDAARSKS